MAEQRDITVAGLIAKLTELIEINPRIAEYEVWLECADEPFSSPWKGTTFQYPERDRIELEA
jgi:hypothetical protein